MNGFEKFYKFLFNINDLRMLWIFNINRMKLIFYAFFFLHKNEVIIKQRLLMTLICAFVSLLERFRGLCFVWICYNASINYNYELKNHYATRVSKKKKTFLIFYLARVIHMCTYIVIVILFYLNIQISCFYYVNLFDIKLRNR